MTSRITSDGFVPSVPRMERYLSTHTRHLKTLPAYFHLYLEPLRQLLVFPKLKLHGALVLRFAFDSAVPFAFLR